MALAPAIYASSTDQAFFALLTFDPANSNPILRYVNNLEDVVSRGNTFQAFPFSFNLMVDDGESIPVLQIQIDNVDQQIITVMRKLEDPPTAKLEIVMSGSLNTVERTVDFLRVTDISYDALTVTIKLQQDNFLNLPAVDSLYTGNEFPDLVI